MYKFKVNDSLFLPHVGAHLEITLNEGESLILNGPNGIGKTTLMRRIYQEEKSKINMVYIEQTPLELFFDRKIKDVRKILIQSRSNEIRSQEKEIWKKFGFEAKENRLVSELSGGEGQLLKLYLGLSKKADFYFLDEPTQYLDADYKNILLKTLTIFMSEGSTFLLIEHDLSWPIAGWKVLALEVQNKKLVTGKSWSI